MPSTICNGSAASARRSSRRFARTLVSEGVRAGRWASLGEGTGRERQLTDLGCVALAAATWIGALAAAPIPLVLVVPVAAGAFLARRPVLLVLAAGAVASGLSAAEHTALVPVAEG